MTTFQDESIKLAARQMPECQGFGIWFKKGKDYGRPILFDDSKPGAYHSPSVILDDDQIQVLMDQLWAAGIRPTQEGTAGQLAATAYHLKDMRTLAFEAITAYREIRKKQPIINCGTLQTLRAVNVGTVESIEAVAEESSE